MFFVKDLEKEINVEPQHFGPDLVPTVERQLFREVEGRQDSHGSWVVAVLCVLSVSRGVVAPFLGTAGFSVAYRALLFKPALDEVLDGTVVEVTKIGMFVQVGPLAGNDVFYISSHQMPAYLSYDPTAQPPRWASGDGSQVLQQDSAVRFRVILVEGQGAATQFGTLRGNYLGPLSS
eukprot:TRINITY_DN164_c5_g1_i1.p1 TRINITY_DN164_c5_g1~~TRINITY_DN164_c5_g1_i1.p1  ORF type:complete len:189 (-),score=80.85 TRINITY_DN164_c5_g1_i1:175-705(-)